MAEKIRREANYWTYITGLEHRLTAKSSRQDISRNKEAASALLSEGIYAFDQDLAISGTGVQTQRVAIRIAAYDPSHAHVLVDNAEHIRN